MRKKATFETGKAQHHDDMCDGVQKSNFMSRFENAGFLFQPKITEDSSLEVMKCKCQCFAPLMSIAYVSWDTMSLQPRPADGNQNPRMTGGLGGLQRSDAEVWSIAAVKKVNYTFRNTKYPIEWNNLFGVKMQQWIPLKNNIYLDMVR